MTNLHRRRDAKDSGKEQRRPGQDDFVGIYVVDILNSECDISVVGWS